MKNLTGLEENVKGITKASVPDVLFFILYDYEKTFLLFDFTLQKKQTKIFGFQPDVGEGVVMMIKRGKGEVGSTNHLLNLFCFQNIIQDSVLQGYIVLNNSVLSLSNPLQIISIFFVCRYQILDRVQVKNLVVLTVNTGGGMDSGQQLTIFLTFKPGSGHLLTIL